MKLRKIINKINQVRNKSNSKFKYLYVNIKNKSGELFSVISTIIKHYFFSKNVLILLILILGYLHVLFSGNDTKVDWYLAIDMERRIDYAVMYLCGYISNILLVYLILFPKGVDKYIKIFLFALTIVDLVFYFLTSGVGFVEIKLIITFVITLISISIMKCYNSDKVRV